MVDRLSRLEAFEDIRNLVSRYNFAVDDRDLKSLAACFADNAQFRSVDGVLSATGREAIMARFDGRFSALGVGAHYTHDHLIDVDSERTATGRVSAHAELIRLGRPMIVSLRYEDRYINEAGRWVFGDRLLSFFYYLDTADYLDGLTRRDQMRAYDSPAPADFPEGLESWKQYYATATDDGANSQ